MFRTPIMAALALALMSSAALAQPAQRPTPTARRRSCPAQSIPTMTR